MISETSMIKDSQGGLTGSWKYSAPGGEMNMQIGSGTIVINNQTFQYKALGKVLIINEGMTVTSCPYMLDGDQLTIEFPGGIAIVFTRVNAGVSPQNPLNQSMPRPSVGMEQGQQASAASNQQNFNQQDMNRQTAGSGATWQLRGTLCSWSGSSNSSGGYSRALKLVFDGQGNYQFGSEASFSSGSGIAYGGDPNVETGTYTVGESTVTLRNSSGESFQFMINMRQDNGMITELMFGGTLYATGLCE